jgi:hypothetical protein
VTAVVHRVVLAACLGTLALTACVVDIDYPAARVGCVSGRCPDGLVCEQGLCVSGSQATLDASTRPDASSPEIDGGVPATCDEIYGAVPGYVACSETGDSCSFNATLNNGTCGALCSSLGKVCITAHDNGIEPCVAGPEETCDTMRGTEICTCSRP